MSLTSQMRRMMNQKIAYWAPKGIGEFGRMEFYPPVIRKARWEDKAEEVVNMAGVRVVSASRVYTNQDIEIQGRVTLLEAGAATTKTDAELLATIPNQLDPEDELNPKSWEILTTTKTPDRKARDSLRMAFL